MHKQKHKVSVIRNILGIFNFFISRTRSAGILLMAAICVIGVAGPAPVRAVEMPIANPDYIEVFSDSTTGIDVLANDFDDDGDPLTVYWVGDPAHGTVEIVDFMMVEYTPNSGWYGVDHFEYMIYDGNDGSANSTVTVAVKTATGNTPPTANSDIAQTDEDVPVAIAVLANDADVDGDTISIASVGTPGHGAAVITGTDVMYAPSAGWYGPDTFVYTISDGSGGSASSTVTVTVKPVGPILGAVWMAEGEDEYGNMGSEQGVASAGDVNGDGYQDVIVGVPGYLGDFGRALVYYGSTNGLSTTPAWTKNGTSTMQYFGRSVASAGDVNSDGYDDVIIGEGNWGGLGSLGGYTGAASIFLGSASGLAADPAWRVSGYQGHSAFGTSVASAGDVNGDGYDDVVVGAPGYSISETTVTATGRTYLFLGSAAGPSTIPAWIVTGETTDPSGYAQFGHSVASAGDVNNDGYSDVLVGSWTASNGEMYEGKAHLYLGSPSGLSTTAAWIEELNTPNAYFGYSVASAGDINSDGYDDVIIGMAYASSLLYLGSANGLEADYSWVGPFGRAVASAGDINGDGYDDVIIGQEDYSGSVRYGGRADIYLGSADGLVQPNSCWLKAPNLGDTFFGSSVASAGDVNGDGYDDVIIGARSYDGEYKDEGAALAFYGSAGFFSLFYSAGPGGSIVGNMSQQCLLSGDNGTIVTAVPDAGYVFAGWSDGVMTATRTDLNVLGNVSVTAYFAPLLSVGDDVYLVFMNATLDVPAPGVLANDSDNEPGPAALAAIKLTDPVNGTLAALNADGSFLYQPNQGFAGQDFFTYHAYDGENYSAVVTVSITVVDSSAFAADWMTAPDQSGAMYGYSAASAGDVNGDGYEDVIIGAPGYTNGENQEGRAFVFLGSASGIGTTPVWTAESDQEAAQLGWSVASAGDVNGDGYDDVIVGVPFVGIVNVYLGSATGLGSAPAWTMQADQFSYFGFSVASAGDVNGDGFGDVIIGAPIYTNDVQYEGRAFVYLGSATGLGSAPAWTGESDAHFAIFGVSVASAGDVNRDGYSDVIVGAPYFSNDQTQEGRAYVYLGSVSGVEAAPYWTVESDLDGSQFGWSAAAAGDVNGDGYPDVIVGAPYAANGEGQEGRALVYLGSASGFGTSPVWTVESDQEGAQMGYSVASAGDFNGDGYGDVVVGAPQWDRGDNGGAGRADIYLGSTAGIEASAVKTIEPNLGNSQLGFSVAPAGDVTGDGSGDVIIGAPTYGYYGLAAAYYGTVTFVNHPPVAAPDSAVIDQDTSATIDVLANDTDEDGDALSITSVGVPGHGTAAITGTGVTYAPAAGWFGTDTFDYAIVDVHGGTASATVTVTVNRINHLPVANPDAASTVQDTPVVIDVLVNDTDADGDALSIASIDMPGHGTVAITGTGVTYTPASGWYGTDTFVYAVSDGNGGTAGSTVTVTVEQYVPSTGNLRAAFDRHTVQTGTKPGSTKAPVVGGAVKAFPVGSGSCAVAIGNNPHNYSLIFANCTAAASALTDAGGVALLNLEVSDNYLVIGLDPVTGVYAGVHSGVIEAGKTADKYLQVIVKPDNTSVPAKTTVKKGSLLLIIEPEYVEWDSATEYYPFIFEAEGDWGVTVTVEPPEGFVADHNMLSTEVDDSLKALQFTLSDVGSCWTCGTGVTFTIKHKGKTEKVKHVIETPLQADFAKKKGLDEHGRKLQQASSQFELDLNSLLINKRASRNVHAALFRSGS